jgi:hypothetical protein
MPVADLWKSHRGGLEISGKLEVCSARSWMQVALVVLMAFDRMHSHICDLRVQASRAEQSMT